MIFLVILFFFVIYLAVSTGVVLAATKWAKKHNRRPWVWGGLAALVMYNLVFWDWIPTLVAHKYYCATQAGFWVYKTPEEWMKENPGVMETLKPYSAPTEVQLEVGNVRKMNERFEWRFVIEPVGLFPITRMKGEIVDIETQDVIIRDVDFRSGYNLLAIGGEGSWKFWLRSDSCGDEQRVRHASMAREFRKKLQMQKGDWE